MLLTKILFKMHELFTQVLSKKDLSKVLYVVLLLVYCFIWCTFFDLQYLLYFLYLLFVQAGDLFSVADAEIVNDLTEVVTTIAEIASLPDYVNNDNDQSVVEICITRVTSAIRLVFQSYYISFFSISKNTCP